jgi:hypothetical protein
MIASENVATASRVLANALAEAGLPGIACGVSVGDDGMAVVAVRLSRGSRGTCRRWWPGGCRERSGRQERPVRRGARGRR